MIAPHRAQVDAAGVEETGVAQGGPGATPADGLPEDLAAFAASPAVQRWLQRTGNADGRDARVADLALLQRFCTSVEADPDELVAQCLRSTKAGDTAISAAGRRRTDQAITAFVTAEGATGRDGIVLANKLRAFLIHNGIFMQGSAAID